MSRKDDDWTEYLGDSPSGWVTYRHAVGAWLAENPDSMTDAGATVADQIAGEADEEVKRLKAEIKRLRKGTLRTLTRVREARTVSPGTRAMSRWIQDDLQSLLSED